MKHGCQNSYEARTSLSLAASASANWAAKVLFPTPPLPDSTKILCRMSRMRCRIAATSAP